VCVAVGWAISDAQCIIQPNMHQGFILNANPRNHNYTPLLYFKVWFRCLDFNERYTAFMVSHAQFLKISFAGIASDYISILYSLAYKKEALILCIFSGSVFLRRPLLSVQKCDGDFSFPSKAPEIMVWFGSAPKEAVNHGENKRKKRTHQLEMLIFSITSKAFGTRSEDWSSRVVRDEIMNAVTLLCVSWVNCAIH
jgi:hypothetical protein